MLSKQATPEEYARKCRETGSDTVVRCPKCGRTQYLQFANGLKNGWSSCHGLTMPIVFTDANIKKAVGKAMGVS